MSKPIKTWVGLYICIISRLFLLQKGSLQNTSKWRTPLVHLNSVYRSLTTHKKAGAEKLPKYENLSLTNQNLREG